MAGAGMKDIKRRIKSVESTMQITKAMELVASSKLRKAKDKAEKSKPFFNEMYLTMKRISENTGEVKSTFVTQREVKTKGIIVIAGDRGLAGGYNANVLKEAVNLIGNKESKIVPVGKKAVEFFAKRNYDIVNIYQDLGETLDYHDTLAMAEEAIHLYEKGQIDELYVVYTEFVSSLNQIPKVAKLLPIDFGVKRTREEYIAVEYEPSPEEVFNKIIPSYIEGMLYLTIVESFASEQGARRIAMESASDNAEDMISNLNLQYNRARQASITQEISEIVSGAEALK